MKNRCMFIKSLIFFICFSTFGYGQFSEEFHVKNIQELIEQNEFDTAQNFIDQAVSYYKSQNQMDSLVRFIPLVGSIKLNQNQPKKAIKQANELTAYITKSQDLISAKNALSELAYLESNYGSPQTAYDALIRSLYFAEKINDPAKAEIHDIQYSLGYNAALMNKIKVAKQHYLKSIDLQLKHDAEDLVSLQIVYNAMGGIMWHEAKLDSADYYFKKSLEVLSKTDKNDLLNQHYRPALVKMNLSVLRNALGYHFESIQYVQDAIRGFENFIQLANDETRVFQAKKHRLVAIENLASFYNTVGEQRKAQELIEYAHNRKKEILEENDINLIISYIVLAEAKIANLDYISAQIDIDQALELLEKSPTTNLYWYATALTTKGIIAEALSDLSTAKRFYQLGESTYREGMQGDYTKNYLDMLIKFSLFYSRNNEPEKAEKLALEIYDFAKTSDFENTLQDLFHTINLAEVYFNLEDYNKAIQFSDEALQMKSANTLSNQSDSILFQYRKPKALYINAQAKFKTTKIDKDFLEELLQQTENALQVLEQRKQIIVTHEDTSLLMAENTQLFDLAKKIRLELYNITKDETYLNEIISVHEAGIYNKIRSRLGLRTQSVFRNIPENIRKREQDLKNNLSFSISNENNSLSDFFDANSAWKIFLDSLKIQYPQYYKMKFASIETSLDVWQENIDNDTSIVRYLFIENKLYAIVLNKNSKKIIELDEQSVRNQISKTLGNTFDVHKMSPIYHDLYLRLWQPLENDLHTKKVVIIPDAELFNLSFETLITQPIRSYKEMAQHSLLAKYVISYHYTLHPISPLNDTYYHSDYIAFAPVFSTQMKEDYIHSVKDSFQIDKNYLSLLSQPFSEKLIQKFSKVFKGKSFFNESATKDIFTKNAGNHKIIHIATHAESDNVSPELSRLIFAKSNSLDFGLNDNFLHTYEIYNTNLNAGLTVLTACETGKPTHQPGEGMISLAHAFNYAGSQSILTSLWKVDEEASAIIVSYFYKNLQKGMDKDVALQQAKLKYLENHNHRMLSPEYWGALILIGDTSALPLENTSNKYFWFLLFLIFGISLLFYFKSKV